MVPTLKFSIIVSTFNRNQEIIPLLDNLRLQTVRNFELILVDDCSDVPVEIGQRIYDYPIRIYRNEKNLGQSKSRNVGVKYAKGAWLMFLDDDDRFHPRKCEVIQSVIDHNPQVNFIYHPARCYMVNEGFFYQTQPDPEYKNLTFDKLLKKNFIGSISLVSIKKSLFDLVEGFSENFKAIEDYELYLKLSLSQKMKANYCPDPLTDYFIKTNSGSVSKNEQRTLEAIESIKEKYTLHANRLSDFKKNACLMMVYPLLMMLSRRAAIYLFKYFLLSEFSWRYCLAFVLVAVSPKLAIKLTRFVK